MNIELKILLARIIVKISDSRYSFAEFLKWGGSGPISYKTFDNAAGNHAFDDHPETFGLHTKQDGHIVRAAFQENRIDKAWLESLIKHFDTEYGDASKSS